MKRKIITIGIVGAFVLTAFFGASVTGMQLETTEDKPDLIIVTDSIKIVDGEEEKFLYVRIKNIGKEITYEDVENNPEWKYIQFSAVIDAFTPVSGFYTMGFRTGISYLRLFNGAEAEVYVKLGKVASQVCNRYELDLFVDRTGIEEWAEYYESYSLEYGFIDEVDDIINNRYTGTLESKSRTYAPFQDILYKIQERFPIVAQLLDL